MDTLLQDTRFAIRSLLKAPLVAALCVLCLAIGIGLNASIYSAVYAVFFRPFSFAEPERLVWISERNDRIGWDDVAVAYETFDDMRGQASELEQVAGFSGRSITLSDSDEPVRLRGAGVSWNLFPVLGVQPHLGRGFREDEDRKGAPGVLLLGYGVWEKRYGGDSSVVGRSIIVNGQPHTIVGVMPQGFMFPEREEAWIPIAPVLDGSSRESRAVSVVGRLRTGGSATIASTQLAEVSRRLEKQYPQVYEQWRIEAIPLRDAFMDRETKLVISTMMGAVTFVLLIACANVANLLLARATTRSREVAIRAALGASRMRIVRQLLTESVVLALVACPVGIWIGYWLLGLIVGTIPEGDLPYYYVFRMDAPVLAYTVVLAIVVGLVFGLAPAMQAARGNLQKALKDGGRGSGSGGGRHRLRTALAVSEVALSMVLLVGASLFVRSWVNMQRQTGGIVTENMLTMRFYLPGARYDAGNAISRRVEDVVERVRAVPGVEFAAASNLIPIDGGGSGGLVEVEGQPVVNRSQAPRVFWTGVTDQWFETLGVPLLSGRLLTAAETRDSSLVAVINESMARRLWPSGEPLGKRFRLLQEGDSPWLTVVGVTRDFREEDNVGAMSPSFFVSYRYLPSRNTGLIIRADREPTQLTSAIRGALRASDPTMPVFGVASMEEVRNIALWNHRLFGWLFSLFGFVALLLASIGVYGVIAYGVSQRTQEIGVRVALGAQPADVIRMVVRGGITLALAGVVLGLVAALGVTRVIQSLLVEVSATDPLSFIGVTFFLGAIALLASYVPARRATRVDPMTALRNE